ncbi:hypothetical protein AB0N14_34545 [Streptomyces sp. NPDC051104]|uniref:hypothetical protein n=1 Tax=Streptomyces sp. NPDC051104 TaxID=3155044 RepID=UPI0034275D53
MLLRERLRVAEQRPEHLVQGGERQAGLRFGTGHPQDAQTGATGLGPGHLQQRGLPHVGITAQEHRRPGGGDVHEGRADDHDMGVPSGQDRFGRTVPGHARTAHDLGYPALFTTATPLPLPRPPDPLRYLARVSRSGHRAVIQP